MNAFDCIGTNDGLQLHDIIAQAAAKVTELNLYTNFVNELKWLLQNFFVECDMSFVFYDTTNSSLIVFRDIYGKRSLVLQAHQSEES